MDRGADVAGMVRAPQSWQTPVYAKPCVAGVETHRFDFGGFNQLPEQSCRRLEDELQSIADTVDVVVVNQQFGGGLCAPQFIAGINRVIATNPRTSFVVDSRHCAGLYHHAILKLNAKEAAAALGENKASGEPSTASAEAQARRLSERTQRPVFLTRGENGIVVADGNTVRSIPGIQIIERIDSVGAGDTTVAALAAALGGGCSPLAAATLANIAASITVRKLHTTGTARPEEIRSVGPQPDYVFSPDLAADLRQATYVDRTNIEIVDGLPKRLQIQHAIFDHDGTLSVLREGWEQIMQPMMVRAVLGDHYATADAGTFAKVGEAVSQLIDKTTGIQTLVQMQSLVMLVKQFGHVPPERILDEHGYKQIYNEALLQMVTERVSKLERGELESIDFQIKNGGRLLRVLYERGVKLYLASGTDVEDVIAEARAMGYADLFEGRVFGAVGDVKVEAKKLVLERIMREHNLSGDQFVMFGDGPVEMREARKRGGVCVGVASDEVRRFGLNTAKRSRLIRAGATVVVPDFSQIDQLLQVLQLT
jgi:phosphoglycolate phosphatase-like HAD superfamily hydrolase